MLVSLNFLKKFINFKNTQLKELVKKMDIFGFEIENIENTNINNLVAGEIKKCKKIPGTHLNLCNIFLGKYGEKQIICGANNARENIKVIVALPGAKLPKMEIKETVIQGYVSEGMCCSLSELGINSQLYKNENEIYELDKNFIPGEENILEKIGFSDIILNIKLPYNRPDLISILNFAKELSILFEFNFKELKINAEKITTKNDLIIKKINSDCSLFSIRIIKNIFLKESPIEIKKILISSGIKPINNIIDYANYVMLLTGCPIHIYDYDKLPKKELIIKKNNKKQDFIALNNKKYTLNENDIVAISGEKIICLSGIIGSLETSITKETKNIAIEIGNFDCFSIRRTSLRLNLLTDSSKRFIQGINNYHYKMAFELLTSLIKKDCNSCLISEIIDNKLCKNSKNKKILINCNEINSILNTKYNQEDIFLALKKCFLNVEKIKDDSFVIYCDKKRKDIQNINDVAEEILRLLGFEKINNELPKIIMKQNFLDKNQHRIKKIKNFLRSFLYEVLTYTLVSKKDNEIFNYLFRNNEEYKIVNPIINERQYIRKNLIPSLLKTINYNLIHQNNNFGIFEISNINVNKVNDLFLSIALVGSYTLQGKINRIPYSIFYLKGIFKAICDILITSNKELKKKNNILITNDEIKENDEKYLFEFKKNFFNNNELHPGRNTAIFSSSNLIGFFGELHPNIASAYGIKEKTFVFEINLSLFFKCIDSFNLDIDFNDSFISCKMNSIAISRFIERDLCLLVDENISNLEVIKIIKNSGGKFVKQVELFDIYDKKKENKKKSMSFNIIFLNEEATLTNEEVNLLMKKILLSLNKKNIFLRNDPTKK